eukprot:g2632.t1
MATDFRESGGGGDGVARPGNTGADGSGDLDSFIYDDDSASEFGRSRTRSPSNEHEGVGVQPCVVEHDVSTCSLLSTTQSGDVFQGFQEHDDMRTAEVSRLLIELDDLLYKSASGELTQKCTTPSSTSDEMDEKTSTIHLHPDQIDPLRRNNLLRRHNFETHNCPQSQHMAPRVEEWTRVFPHFRICGASAPHIEANTKSFSTENHVLEHDPASERPLLHRPGSPICSPRDNGVVHGVSADLFAQGHSLPIETPVEKLEKSVHSEVILASHGQCAEWIEFDKELDHEYSNENANADRNKMAPDPIFRSIPPVEPASALYDAIASAVFDSLWFKITPLVLPLIRVVLNMMLDAGPLRRHEARSSTPSPGKRYASGAIGSSSSDSKADCGPRFPVAAGRWDEVKVTVRSEMQNYSPIHGSTGDDPQSGSLGLKNAMTIKQLSHKADSIREVYRPGSNSKSSLSPTMDEILFWYSGMSDTYLIRHVPVSFPFKPYPSQLVYMENVIQALQERKHALLESPTGTGKTMSLLCSALAWRQAQDAQLNSNGQVLSKGVIHQLSQVVKELKGTIYRPNVAILGSREQLCVNSKVNRNRGTKLNRACQELTKNRKCRYHLGVEDYMETLKISKSISSKEAFDAANQRAHTMSTFHVSTRNELDDSNETTTNQKGFPTHEIQDIEELHEFGKRSSWQDAVVICDEAHNLEAVCADASSFELEPEILANALEECDSCLYLLNGGGESVAGGMNSGLGVSQSGDMNAEKIQMLRCVLATFEQEIATPKFPPGTKGFTVDGAWLLDLMQRLNVTQDSKKEFFEVMDGVIEMRMTHNKSKRCYMETVKKAMAIVLYKGLTPEIASACYRVHIYVKAAMSGNEYQSELGYTIANFARLVPEGMLIFFPSYSVMEKCLEFWKSRRNKRGVTIWDQICRQKSPFVEPRSSSEFGSVVRSFEETTANGQGAIFFAVCRGKASEGIDFSDHCARAVVLTGMPFPPLYDPKVQLKR